MEEQWRIVEGTDGLYQVSDLGRVACTRKGKFRIVAAHTNPKGYYYYHQNIKGKSLLLSLSRAVAKAFPEICGEWFEGCEIDHINTDKGDNRAENLRVVTHLENMNNKLSRLKMSGFDSWEDRAAHKKEMKRLERIRCREYYKNYYQKYQKEHKEKIREYQRKRNANLTEEQKNKNRERARKYYYEHREEINAKQKERYKKKEKERWVI